MAELIFEIGCEEMPARFVAPAIGQLKDLAQKRLAQAGLLPAAAMVQAHGTPRRLALLAPDVLAVQPDATELQLGPPAKAAFDADGNPTKAALGFAKSQGVEVGALGTFESDKGPRLGVERTIPGRPAAEVLSELLPGLVESLHFPKTMRWGAGEFRFARPIHWFLALLDGAVVPFTLAGIKSGGVTYGHRFMAPGAIEVSSLAGYVDSLRQAQVIVDRNERKSLTMMEVETTAQVAGGRLVDDPGLLEEVTDLVELPVACRGSFDPEYLKVPRAVIISAMRSHQRYFALEDGDGGLLNAFIAVNNTKPKDLSVVSAGHEKVLRARLADARFFLDEDLRTPLIERLEELKDVTYHAKLGSSYDKVQRFAALAAHLAERLAPHQVERVRRAAELCKCDLVTEMVGEFPDLQGVVGAEYAARGGEDPQVSQAIAEHYMPLMAGGDLPAGTVGACVGLADRLDTICGMFGIGNRPSGAADPYGLRRAAIAIIRIVTEKKLELPLSPLLDQALENLKPWLHAEDPKKEASGEVKPLEETKLEVFGFILDRMQGLLADQGVPTDVTAAVLAVSTEEAQRAFLNPGMQQLPEHLDDLVHIRAKALALAEVKDSEEFLPLAIGMKRVMNILRKEAGQVPAEAAAEGLMGEGAEKELYAAHQGLGAEAGELLASGDYLAYLKRLSALKGPIDKFFDDVLVMDPDQAVRRNRLAMLNEIAARFRQVAEFTVLQLG